MRFTVTQDDIEQGVACSPRRCPLARALHRDLPRAVTVIVGQLLIMLGRGEKGPWEEYDTPHDMVPFIRAFDDGRTVSSRTFIIPGLNRKDWQ